MKAELKDGFGTKPGFIRLYVDKDVYYAVYGWLKGAGFNVTGTVFSNGTTEINVGSKEDV